MHHRSGLFILIGQACERLDEAEHLCLADAAAIVRVKLQEARLNLFVGEERFLIVLNFIAKCLIDTLDALEDESASFLAVQVATVVCIKLNPNLVYAVAQNLVDSWYGKVQTRLVPLRRLIVWLRTQPHATRLQQLRVQAHRRV